MCERQYSVNYLASVGAVYRAVHHAELFRLLTNLLTAVLDG